MAAFGNTLVLVIGDTLTKITLHITLTLLLNHPRVI